MIAAARWLRTVPVEFAGVEAVWPGGITTELPAAGERLEELHRY
jgi:hypothetical protein